MKKQIKKEELNGVNGGDYGDYKKEMASTPEGVRFLYNVGDRVEVYHSGAHIKTHAGTVIERTTTSDCANCSIYYFGYYKVKLDTGTELWVNANDIEST